MMYKILIINENHEQYGLIARVPITGDRISFIDSDTTFVTLEVVNVTLSAYPIKNTNVYPTTHTVATVFVKPIN